MEKLSFPFYHRCFAKIDLAAISDNFDNLKAKTGPDTLTCSVIKADAYGHGAVRVAKLLQNRTDFFAVAEVAEAVTLRENDIQKPILVLGYTSPFEYESLLSYDITPAIYSVEEVQTLSELAKKHKKVQKIHIAIDTGMSRIGFAVNNESADSIAKIAQLDNIEIEGMFSHYATADFADKSSALAQRSLFEKMIEMLSERGINIPIKHISNSAAVMDMDKHFDMVRYGIALYGLYPSDDVNHTYIQLKPAMSIYSHVVRVQTISAGQGIGYGHTYVPSKDEVIATISIGYADGYKRCLTNKGWVLINGKRAPIRGKVCMDLMMVDVTDIYDVNVGDIAVIMGSYGDDNISAELLGELSHSFNYEIVSTFMPRAKRFYYDKNRLLDK